MSVAFYFLALLAIGDAEQEADVPTTADSADMTQQAPKVTPKPQPKSRRTERELEFTDRQFKPRLVPSSLELLRPELLAPRKPGAALALGLLVGFGAGHYYAGENKKGLLFSVLDSAAIGGLFGATFALNQLVVQHDIRSGKSLKRGERDFGEREEALYITSWLLLGTEIASRVVQSVSSYRAAGRTNLTLDGYSVIPLQ